MSKQDSNNNIIETQYAEYYENKKIFISKGVTKFTSSENYFIRMIYFLIMLVKL